MSLAHFIKHGRPAPVRPINIGSEQLATATVVTVATVDLERPSDAVVDAEDQMRQLATVATDELPSVAIVASVAVANAEKRWQYFVDECVLHGVTLAEVQAGFSEQDIDDLLTEPDSKLPLHARTVAESILRDRQRVEIERAKAKGGASSAEPDGRVHRFGRIPKQVCSTCQHFHRTDHPHIGHCRVKAVEEPAAGLWDSDTRDYCDRWKLSL